MLTGDATELIGLGQSSRKKGDHAAALRYFEAAPENLVAAVEIATTLVDLNRLEEAEARYRAVLKNAPGHVAALTGLAQLAQRRGDMSAAVDWLGQAADSDPSKVALQLQVGRILRSLDRLDEAEARFRQVVERSPGCAGALINLAEIAKRRGDLPAALALYERVASSDAGKVAVQFGMADTLRKLGRFDEADAHYRAVLEQRPDHVGALSALGDTARSRGDLTAALAWFETAAANQPHCLSIKLKIGGVLQALARYKAAEVCYRAVLEQIPGHAGALIGLGQTARLQGDLNAALFWFQAAAAGEPSKTRLQIQIADTLRELLRLEEAENAYRAILQASPADVSALVGLGQLERKRKNEEAALAFFEAAAAEAPGNPKVWLLVASALRRLCRFEEAGEIYTKVKDFRGVDESELQVRRFEYFCLTLQLVEAEKCLFAWGGHRGVPRGAVILTAELFAALGQWSNVLAFFRERVVESEWVGSYDRMVEPLTRAARATGRYAEVCELLDRLPNASTSDAVRQAQDQLAEEMRLLRLLDPTRLEAHQALDRTIADPFRAGRAELLAGVLQGRLADPKATQIFTCTDAAYLIGASVCLFSLLKHNKNSLRDCRFTVFCADNVLDLGATVFGRIGAAFATPIDVRASSSLFSQSLDLRTGWGHFTPGRALSQAAYCRIFAARQLIDEGATGRALYIDADTCVFSGLDRLLAFELAGQPLGVRLHDVKNPGIRRAATLLGLELDRYFNSGVLVFDLRHPELRPTLDRTIEISLTEQHRLTHVDQCALNLAFRDKFATLPEQFNLLIKPDTPVEGLQSQATVIHYISEPKPWDPMYATPNCMPWLKELAAMADVIAPDLIKRLFASQYPAIKGIAQRAPVPVAFGS
jgi:tetratricopeptide (TPR) repeat protein